MVYIYDIETYNNFFCVTFLNVKTEETVLFVVDNTRNDIDKLVKFVNDESKWLIGYNSFSFDNPILNYIIKAFALGTLDSGEQIAWTLYNLAINLIDTGDKTFRYNTPFRWIDLMKLGGFYKSLKLVGVSLKWHKLQDLPYPVDAILTEEQKQEVIKYNLNDVLITYELYKYLLPEIKMRYEISQRYHIDAYSESRSGLANRLLEKFYHNLTGIPVSEFKKLRTIREFISFRDVIFDTIHFQTAELDKLYEDLIEFNYYRGQPFFSKVVEFHGIKYKLGFGGIHSVDKPGYFEADNNTELIDADFGSYYPSIIINNRLTPAHLEPGFLDKYEEIRDTRLRAKHEGDMVVSDALKITLNATFGKMLNENHWLYDPLQALRITVNGQLQILMLIERLELAGIKVISANTDGVVSKVTKDKKEIFQKITQEFGKEINISIDYTYYSKYIRKDVNNYIAIKTNGDVKTKGIFNPKIDVNKGYTTPIVSIALYEYFVNNKPYEETIHNHTDILDFCTAKNIDEEKFTNIIEYIKDGILVREELQKSVRYYVSNNGVILSKLRESDGGKIQYESRITVTIFNDYFNSDNYNIDYKYYERAVRSIVNDILEVNKQLTLF